MEVRYFRHVMSCDVFSWVLMEERYFPIWWVVISSTNLRVLHDWVKLGPICKSKLKDIYVTNLNWWVSWSSKKMANANYLDMHASAFVFTRMLPTHILMLGPGFHHLIPEDAIYHILCAIIWWWIMLIILFYSCEPFIKINNRWMKSAELWRHDRNDAHEGYDLSSSTVFSTQELLYKIKIFRYHNNESFVCGIRRSN